MENRTISNIFYIPLLAIGRQRLEDQGFINSYTKDLKRDIQYDYAVYLLFKPKSHYEFNNFLREEEDRKAKIIDEYDYPGGYTVLVYKLPMEFKSDIDLVSSGKYSKVSNKFKDQFVEFTEYRDSVGRKKSVMSLQHMIFNKDLTLRKHWKDKYDIDLTDEDEHYSYYPERDELNIDKICEEHTK